MVKIARPFCFSVSLNHKVEIMQYIIYKTSLKSEDKSFRFIPIFSNGVLCLFVSESTH